MSPAIPRDFSLSPVWTCHGWDTLPGGPRTVAARVELSGETRPPAGDGALGGTISAGRRPAGEGQCSWHPRADFEVHLRDCFTPPPPPCFFPPGGGRTERSRSATASLSVPPPPRDTFLFRSPPPPYPPDRSPPVFLGVLQGPGVAPSPSVSPCLRRAMNMRSTVFASGCYKLDAEKIELERLQAGSGVRREPRDFAADVHPDVLGDIRNSGGQPHPGSKAKKLREAQASKAARTPVAAGQNKAQGAAVGQEENWVSLGALTAPGKPMGGEGTPAKSKTLFGQTHSSMGKTDPPALNAAGRSAEGPERGAPAPAGGPPELGSEGKWKTGRKAPGHSPTQATCLRQILLLQLDLIEQQQQQLQSKDKEIDELKAEKETLLARLERMERRMQLVKKDSRDKQRLFQSPDSEDQGGEADTPEREEFPEGGGSESPQIHNAKPLPFSRAIKGPKRKFSFLDSQKTPKSRGKSSKLSPQKESESEGGSPCQRELRSKETPEKTSAGGRPPGDTPPQPREEPGGAAAEMEELPYMATTEMYLCRWHQPPPSPLREPSPKKEEVVAIPSWRENTIEPLEEATASDIAENLDDGAFLKRHAKLELDEKRRKRWDIQRIREQRMFQRLQQRMYKKKGIQESEPEVSSFYPDTDDVESLMITPFLPVVAFGRPLPKLTQQNFELPWLDERSRCRIEMQKKQTPHRTCRK
ncbi:male-specific lethal 1-like 1 isoform X2 [Lepisosteus oculatus]|uniref:male-specific lethal 1-like 1 isoform X2 n=1 Tax=Lepisosteus oculatus TaxID=7918 RepID=UPI0037157FAB